MGLPLKRSLTVLAFCLALSNGAARADGTLVIVGGGLDSENRAVFEAFANALPADGKVIVIPAASAGPASSAQSIRTDLNRYGIAAERLETFPLAVLDDESTADVDESAWRDNAWDEARVAGLGDPAGFWFTGGDQTRIVESLRREPALASPLLQLIRRRLADGAVVGGTSAGAAVMSRHMIAGGQSFSALLETVNRDYRSSDIEQGDRLLLSKGAGFLPIGLVDQHFDVRARLGRLVRALGETGEPFGYGVAEDTALLVDLETRQATVLGSGGVTLLDASAADFDFDSNELAQGLRIGYAAPGARFALGRCELSGDIGTATRGSESSDDAVHNGGGMAFAHRDLEDLLGSDLLDNSASSRIERFSMRDNGSLLTYTFSETPDSTGYRTEGDGPTRYSACNVRFDVTRAGWEVVDRGR